LDTGGRLLAVLSNGKLGRPEALAFAELADGGAELAPNAGGRDDGASKENDGKPICAAGERLDPGLGRDESSENAGSESLLPPPETGYWLGAYAATDGRAPVGMSEPAGPRASSSRISSSVSSSSPSSTSMTTLERPGTASLPGLGGR
jgi:hypothetical protein